MNASEIIAALKTSYLFDDFSEEDLKPLAEQCRRIDRKAGEILFQEGAPADYFYILLSGRVQAYKISMEGKEMILHLFNPGDIFAEFPVFSGAKTYPVSTLCLKDSKFLAIYGHGFMELAVSRPHLLFKMLIRLSERLRYLTALVEDLSLRSVDARLAKYLLTVSRNINQEAAIEIQKKTLAAILGTVPESLSRAFKKLSQANVITVQGNSILILDRQELERLADM